MAISKESPSGREIIYRISERIAERTDADVSELPPLYETIDPDALGAFLRGPNGTETDPERSVEFAYCGYRVTVDSTGQAHLHPEP